MGSEPKSLVVIGSSTGGPEALRKVLVDIRLNAPIIIVQHMPLFINESLRQSLETVSRMKCVLPKSFDLLEPGVIYLAPSEKHLRVSAGISMILSEGEPVNFVTPSIDVTMGSLSPLSDRKYAGVILTGMGKDGAQGIKHIKSLGGLTMAQTPATCSIDSMPQRAIETGQVDHIFTLEKIREKLIEEFR